jgi:hypothetical protein
MSDEKATESKNPSIEEMTKSAGEKQLKEEELNKVSGGSGCCTGKHIPGGIITV